MNMNRKKYIIFVLFIMCAALLYTSLLIRLKTTILAGGDSRLLMLGCFVIPAFTVFVVFYYGRNILKSALQEQTELKAMTENLSVGILRCASDDPFSFEYASESTCRLLGYSQTELFEKFGGNLMSIMNPIDGRRVSAEYWANADHNSFVFEYRLRHKNGDEIWVSENAKIVHSNSNRYLFSVLMDITASKAAMQDKFVSDECYRIIYRTSNLIIADYDVEHVKMAGSESFAEKFGWMLPDGRYPEAMRAYIFEEDYKIYRNLFLRASTSDEHFSSGELRLLTEEGEYLWCRVELYGVSNEEGRIARILTTIQDINEEQQEKLDLEQKSLRDVMTGAYNKAATESLITQFLQGPGRNGIHAFLLIDIDDFKRVNDRFGHMEGDRVIVSLVAAAQKSMDPGDIVGRIGGDEFVLFMKDIQSESIVVERIQRFLECLREVIVGQEYPVSVSIGGALFPEHAMQHDELYRFADKALYKAKYTGKNTFQFYG